MLRIFYISFIFLFSCYIYGQDLTFSQFYQSPSATNPSLSVVFAGKNIVGTSLKRQWFTIEKNKYLSLSNAFYNYKINILKGDYLGLGASVYDERNNYYGKTTGFFNIAYSKLLNYSKYTGQSQYLIFGFQAGYGKTFINNIFIFGSQFDKIREVPDINISSGEEELNSKTFADLNTGLMWYWTGRNNSIYLGIGAYHINRPNMSLLRGGQNKIQSRYSFLIGGEIKTTREISIMPATYFNFQSPLYQFTGGANIRYEYQYSEKNAFRIGLWSRITNTLGKLTVSDIIISSILEFNGIDLGFSYDFNISEFRLVNGSNTSFELSLIYVWGENSGFSPYKSPRF